MKPHIKKVNGVWWCYIRHKKEVKAGSARYIAMASDTTVDMAYYKWCKKTNTPHKGGLISCCKGLRFKFARPISPPEYNHIWHGSWTNNPKPSA